MLKLRNLLLLVLAAGTLFAPHAHAEFKLELEYSMDAKWAEFEIGSWKLVRVYRDAIDSRGRVKSTSTDEIRSTLRESNKLDYTILVEVTTEVAGRRYEKSSQLVKKHWNGKDDSQYIELENEGTDAVVIEGHDYTAERRSFFIQAAGGRRSRNSVWYSATVSPYVLKMETSYLDPAGLPQREVELDVIAVEMPHKVLSEIKSTSHVRIRERSIATGNETVTVEVQCPDVPGWVVSRSSKLLDKDGDVVQRTTLELVDYEVAGKDDARSLLGGKRRNRRGRRATR